MSFLSPRFVANRLARRIFSQQRWLVLRRKLDGPWQELELPVDLQFRPATPDDAKSILDALPSELIGHMPPSHAKALVETRFARNIPCFLALKDGKPVAGCWCPGSSNLKYFPSIAGNAETTAEITTLFVTPECRGRGVSTYVCRYAAKALYEMGYQQCLSLVWYTRPASVRTHLKAGFSPIGEKITRSVAGFRWVRASEQVDNRYMSEIAQN